ncbi:hypothetical protein [Nocardia aurantia]|uniref:DUF8020 domain-containing protein n=1 Tax=Nocardia aurantia TaxID=2585199 RepID=A0A7K0DYR1_9NOCA|nr:hypothetical protein [Nocardia aurantia]MQY30946.1 hypothetical protein [Nocardia aurantia]
MNIYRSALVAAATSAMIAAGSLSAAAAPAAEPVSYDMTLADGSVVTSLQHGVFGPADATDGVPVRDSAGQVLTTLPTTATLDGQRLPLRPRVSADNRTLTLTPDLSAFDRNAAQPIASPVENQLALNDLINAVNVSTALGSLVGTAVGAVAGLGIGFVVAGASCVVISLGCAVAIMPTMALAAGVGGIAGLILAGGPATIGAAYQYITTLTAPDGTTKYGGRDGHAPDPAPADATR